jgi:hypothetical protein
LAAAMTGFPGRYRHRTRIKLSCQRARYDDHREFRTRT